MSDLAPTYDPKAVEERIYRLWEESGYFNPDTLPPRHKKPFIVIMPPPNSNGALHVGHALMLTLQDIMIRFERMRGRKTLWLPGADHAGFETQVVFDKKLEKEGRNRFEIPREELFKEMWEFTQKNKKVMEDQIRKIGASCDWSREKFTLDPEIVKVVCKTFQKMHKDGLIYRDLRVVNWCPKHQTALSDLEVKYVEREDPLYYIKYGPLTLATVRPETKFGDTALAVNPKDKRYQKYIGKEIEAKGLLGPLTFKVIGDDAVDPNFGTGVVKVTPAHDPADFEIWARHKNEIPGPKQIIDERGRLTGATGPYAGLKVAEARQKVVEDMQKIGILEKVDQNYKHQVATCYKCGNTLEPLPKPQWFVRMTSAPKGKKSLRDMAITAVKSKKITFVTKRFEKAFFHWMKNLRDWNISRQIVWGIQIPAWYCAGCGNFVMELKPKGHMFLVRHGETDWNKEHRAQGHSTTPLNSNGIEQAKKITELLKSKKIDLVISSDLPRARETAEIISRTLNIELVIDERFRERGYGVAEGLLHDEIRAQGLEGSIESFNRKPEGGETWLEMAERVHEALKEHLAIHGEKNIVFITHGGPMRAYLHKVKRVPLERLYPSEIKNTQIFEADIVSEKCATCDSDLYERDPDVFDTWFSSGQWPFAVLMVNRKAQDAKQSDVDQFYPTDVMATGYDIIFFWVARMIMFGLYRTGKVPFKNIYLHGLVRDKDKQKMSKSKGNVIDPLGIAETYGMDALRMGVIAGTAAGNDIALSEDKIRGYRNFATKIWNIGRFILMQPQIENFKQKTIKFTAGDKKHIKEFEAVKKKVTQYLESFQFHRAAEGIYHYLWHTFADKIVEEAKLRLREGSEADGAAAHVMLLQIFSGCLKLLHPMMPFVTEEIFQKLPGNEGKILMIEEW